MQQDLLPLFPLGMVLLPGTKVALHIFEERYKEMIGVAIKQNTEFGIVLASDKGIVNTGCTAVVQKVTHTYEDGRMDIVATGRRRFEILFLNEEREYLRGTVEFFEDEEEQPAAGDTFAKVATAYEDLAAIEETPEFEGEPKLSFRCAQLIDDVNMRQMMLSLRSESARLKQLAEFLPDYVARVKETGRLRALARNNGHGRRAIDAR